MRVQAFTFAVLLSAVCAAPSFANPESEAKRADPNEKIICKTEQVVGSRTRERVCRTRAEWERARAMTREMLDHRGGGEISVPPAKSS